VGEEESDGSKGGHKIINNNNSNGYNEGEGRKYSR
jgi:hypothetical protein